MAFAVNCDEVLLREPGLVRGIEGLPDRASGLKCEQSVEIDRVGIVGGPPQYDADTVRAAGNHRSPDRVFDLKILAGVPGRTNPLGGNREKTGPLGCQIACRIAARR